MMNKKKMMMLMIVIIMSTINQIKVDQTSYNNINNENEFIFKKMQNIM